MSTKYIDNGAYATTGYTLTGVFRSITIGPAGTIGGVGLIGGASAAYTIVNLGRITGTTNGIELKDGGSVTNSVKTAVIDGTLRGIYATGTASVISVINAGTIEATGTSSVAGIVLDSGTIANTGTAALIAGSESGISADGAATVTNAGTIEATGTSFSFYGIYLFDGGTVVNTGTAALIEGGDNGIYAKFAAAAVTNTGTIEGTLASGFGIFLHDGGRVANTATAALVEGGEYGIVVEGAAATVTNSGTIETAGTAGTNNFGVFLEGGTVANTGKGALIKGVTDGIIAEDAAATVTNAGTIEATGTSGVGIELDEGGAVANAGTAALVAGAEYGLIVERDSIAVTNAFTVTNAGTIEATGTTGSGIYLGGGRITNIGTSALIEGGSGISVGSGVVTIANAGAIKGTRGIGISLEAGGVVTNGIGALIEGAGGIHARGATTVTNAGTIFGTYSGFVISGMTYHLFGVYLSSGGNVTSALGGTIGATGAYGCGIELASAGSVSNDGTIAANGSTGIGVTLRSGGFVANIGTSALIEGGSGIIAEETAIVVNAGRVVGTFVGSYNTTTETKTRGFGIELAMGGVSNALHGLIEATGTFGAGVGLSGAGTATNAGTITATGSGGIGVYFLVGGVGINSAGALISGNYGVYDKAGKAIFTNLGTIDATGGDGLFLNGGGTVTNGGAGLILGTNEGIGLDEGGLVSNAGTIVAGRVGIDSIDCALVNTGTIESSQGEGLSGFGIGVGVASGSITNSATASLIEGYLTGISAGRFHTIENVTISNSGTIEATGTYFAVPYDPITEGFDTGINLSSGGTILNNQHSSMIRGDACGIYSQGYPAEIVNSGTILGRVDYGVELRVGGTVTNMAGGLIEGALGIAATYDSATVTNAGTIEGGIGFGDGGRVTNTGATSLISGAGTVDGIGVIAIKGPGTVVNFGTIASTAGAAGTAVTFESNTDVLIDEAGSHFIGKVTGGGGTLELAGTSGALTGLGTSFAGFGRVDVLAGAGWTLAGTNVVASGSTLVDSGRLTLGGTSTLAGAISGTGTLVLDGIETLAKGAAPTVADIVVSGGAATLTASVTATGGFSQSAGTITIGTGDALTLIHTASLTGGTIKGAGALITKGTVGLADLTLAGGITWNNGDVVDESGTLTLGNAGGGSGKLSDLAGSIFDVTGNGGIAVASGGTGNIINEGLFEKTGGTGASLVAAALANTGTIAVTSGTLDIAGAVTGAGRATIGAKGTLEFGSTVAATETISFSGTTGGALLLADPAGKSLGFAGTVAGFGGPDVLDLTSFAFSGKPPLSWTQSGATGTLTVTDGADVARITLFGQYAAAGFKKAKDAGTGTVITYATPQVPATLANAHP